MNISLREIVEIYRDVVDGARQQTLPGELEAAMESAPRDPIKIARGIEAAFGFQINIKIDNFYESTPDTTDRQKDLCSFYIYRDAHVIDIFLNKSRLQNGSPLLSEKEVRFVLLKEILTAVLRKIFISTGHDYPDTNEIAPMSAYLLDYASEPFSMYDFDDGEYAKTVKIENAAELLAWMFLVDIGELYNARRDLHIKPKDFWGIGNGIPDLQHDDRHAEELFAFFDYDAFAKQYDTNPRIIEVLIKTDGILKIVDSMKSAVDDLANYFVKIRTTLYDFLSERLYSWIRQADATIDSTGHDELNAILSKANTRIDAPIDESQTNLVTLLEQARIEAKQKPISRAAIRKALEKLCPLFPFC
ncbi:MAG: hypothetical protein KDJ44_16540 [Rhodoblastus sp.]|nr:hypothetical protein [Rhodoblastus sp.]